MVTHRLFLADGTDLGQLQWPVFVRLGEEIIAGDKRRFRVLDVVPFEEKDEPPFVGLLQVDALCS
jgi:hypothetical protein